MAKQEVGLKIDVDVSSVGNMKQQLRAATNELVAMNEKFGSTSKEAIAAAQKVAGLKDAIGDAKSLADAFNPDAKFKALGQTLGAVAGGFAAVQGAMGLLGNESEDLQKTLVKVQSALAISQGLEQIGDLGQAFKNLKAVAVNAFNGIKAAIGSTGIGLLVVALGTIVAYWDDIKAAVSGVSEEQKKLNKASSDNLKTQQDKLKAIGDQDNILKLQGKSEKDILQIKVKQTDETIKAAEVNLQNSIATAKAQTEAAQRNKDILEGVLKFLTVPITALLKGIDLIGQAVGKNFGLEEKFFGGIANLIFNPEETKKKGDETIKEQEKALAELKNQRAGFQLAINKIDEDAEKKRLEDKKKREEEEAKRAKERAEALAKEQRDINELIQKELDDQFAQDEAKRKQTEAEIKASDDRIFNFQLEAGRKRIELQKELNARTVAAEIDLQNAKFEAASAGLNALSTLAGDNEKLANVLFAVDKGLAIAKIIVDTQREIGGYFAANAVFGLPGAALAAKQALAAKIRAGASIATIIATSIAKFKKGGSSGGGGNAPTGGGVSTSAPLAPQLAPQVTATAVNTAAVNEMGNRATRAYVLNSDIQNNDQRNAYINRNASIG
jgi:hypothetical protein